MHIFFSGIGGTGIGPLSLIAKQAGYEVSGSDSQNSDYIKYLTHALNLDSLNRGIPSLENSGFSAGQATQGTIYIGQSAEKLAEVHAKNPIDWLVYSSALPKTDPNHPELSYANENGIKTSKRDELLNKIIEDKNLKLIAIAGTHGKTTTTAMVIWLFKHLGIPVSYSLGAKISFGEMGEFDPASEYFVYEADEYDHNFLEFKPYMSLITGIDWDHPDIYPTREEYYDAFRDFIDQSEHATLWQDDVNRLNLTPTDHQMILKTDDQQINNLLKLLGLVNRQNAWLTANGLEPILNKSAIELSEKLNQFPGVSRRFEQIIPNLYSDYAHTPMKIKGALQLAHEVAGEKLVVVYEGLHNFRQHFIKDDLKNLFENVKKLYIVPSYLAREDPKLEILSQEDLIALLNDKTKLHAEVAELNQDLKNSIKTHLAAGQTVLCLSAGGADSLDGWLRREFNS